MGMTRPNEVARHQATCGGDRGALAGTGTTVQPDSRGRHVEGSLHPWSPGPGLHSPSAACAESGASGQRVIHRARPTPCACRAPFDVLLPTETRGL